MRLTDYVFWISLFGIMLCVVILSVGFGHRFSEEIDGLYYMSRMGSFDGDAERSVEDISLFCNSSSYLSLHDKVMCVKNIVNPRYVRHDEGDLSVYAPEKTLAEGGVCRDYAVLYSLIFKDMGLKTEYVRITDDGVNGHVFVVVYDSDLYYCIVDQSWVSC